MKRIIVSLSFIFSIALCIALFAQENDSQVKKITENSLSNQNPDKINVQEWTNHFERFVGIWSLERSIVDPSGKEKFVHPGTFMIVYPNASYTIFVYTDTGALITSQGTIIVESSDAYVEVISQHMNSSLIGVSNRIDYKISSTCLEKSFWIEKDRQGGDYKREVIEKWIRAKLPLSSYEENLAFPI